MNAPTLYELVAVFREEAAVLSDIDIPQECLLDTIEGMQWPIEQKSRNTLAIAAELSAQAEIYKVRAGALQAHYKALQARSDWLKDYVLTAMLQTGISEIKGPDFVAKIRFNPPAVVIDNEAGIPDEFWRVIPETREPDKSKIKEALKDGAPFPFAHLETKKRLEIK